MIANRGKPQIRTESVQNPSGKAIFRLRAIRRAVMIAGLIPLVLASCGDSSTGKSNDHIVAGVNLTDLFKPPTATERAAVETDWDTRTHVASGVAVISTTAITLDGAPASVRVVSHQVDGVTHYGAVIAVDNAQPSSQPILVYSHGGDDGTSVEEVLAALPTALGDDRDEFVYVIPSFRSEPIRYGNQAYTSTGAASPWDHDVDDALSLIDAALELIESADSTRIGVVGFSRGAAVGMLMGIRDPRLDLVVEYFGPTDFFGDFAQEVIKDALLDSLPDLPGLATLNEEVIQPLKRGELSYSEARLEMLRRSSVYFVDRLPPTQAHHGTADNVVPVTEAYTLRDAFTEAGLAGADYQVHIHFGAGHTPFDFPTSFAQVHAFLLRLLNPA